MPYKVLGILRDAGLGKDMNSGVHVPYMSELQRDAYKVTVHNGVVWWQYAPLDMGNQSFLYVMDAGGNIFSGPQSEVEHHSSFLSGQPVAAAGMWQVAKGSVLFINGDSGHYQPPGDFSAQFIEEFRQAWCVADRGQNGVLHDVRADEAADEASCRHQGTEVVADRARRRGRAGRGDGRHQG
jgi:hypothetical protein